MVWIHKDQIAGDNATRIFHCACGKIRNAQNIQLAVRVFNAEVLIVKLQTEFSGFQRKRGILFFAGNSANTNWNIVGASFQAFPIADRQRDQIGRHLGRGGKLQRMFAVSGSRRVGDNFAIRDGSVTFVDDYAHLPSEVRAMLAAARDAGWPRVIAVFQPHRYSRIKALGREFGNAFADADVVVVTDIYGAGEAPIPGVSGELVVDAVRQADPDKDVRYVPGRSQLRRVIEELVRPGDLCFTLGAGDLTSLPDELLDDPGW